MDVVPAVSESAWRQQATAKGRGSNRRRRIGTSGSDQIGNVNGNVHLNVNEQIGDGDGESATSTATSKFVAGPGPRGPTGMPCGNHESDAAG